MNVSKSGAILPLTFCVVISVSLSTLTIWTLNSTPIGFVISATSRAAWMFCLRLGAHVEVERQLLAALRADAVAALLPAAASSIWLALSTSSG